MTLGGQSISITYTSFADLRGTVGDKDIFENTISDFGLVRFQSRTECGSPHCFA
jgi:hypothetical protein